MKKLKFIILLILISVLFSGCTNNCIKNGECIEVCGSIIATAKANSDICYFGCVEYEGEWVNYQILQLALESCGEEFNYSL